MTGTASIVPVPEAGVRPAQPKAASSSSLVGPRLLGASTAGILELLIFHPIDTIAKRLMHNTADYGRVKGPAVAVAGAGGAAAPIQGGTTLSRIIFQDMVDASALRKFGSLFPGLGFAAGYKVLQRIYKFGGQPFVNDFLQSNWGPEFRRAFGERQGLTMQHATAGSIIGVGEVLLLPLDHLKVMAQTTDKSVMKSIIAARPSIPKLYAGASWTAARNAPGSFALFGGAQLTHSLLRPDAKPGSPAPFAHHALASVVGASLSIVVAAPLDVIKTRVQAAKFDAKPRGRDVLVKMLREEGVGAAFKGLTPKLLVVGPKLVFSFTVAQYLTQLFTHGERGSVTHVRH